MGPVGVMWVPAGWTKCMCSARQTAGSVPKEEGSGKFCCRKGGGKVGGVEGGDRQVWDDIHDITAGDHPGA